MSAYPSPRHTLLALLIVSSGSDATRLAAQPATTERAADSLPPGWSSAPLPVPRGMLLRGTAIASGNGAAYLAANVVDTTGKLHREPLLLVRLPGRRLPVPAGAFTFAAPRLVVAGDTLHLLWGEGRAELGPGMVPNAITSLWHARFAAGRWSTPERIWSAAVINWPPLAFATRDGRGAIHLVMPSAPDTRNQGLFQLTYASGRWTTAQVAAWATYSAIIRVATERYLLAHTGVDTAARRARNGVIVLSSDDGRTWRRVAVVRDSATRTRTRELWMGEAPDGMLHLSWLQGVPGEDELLLHSASRDGGFTWSPPDTLTATRGLVLTLGHAVTRCALYTVIEQVARDTARVQLVRTGTSGARSWTLHPGAIAVMDPAIHFDGTRLHLAVSVVPGLGRDAAAQHATHATC